MKSYKGYHNNNFTEKLLRDGVKTFDLSLSLSPDAYTVKIGDRDVEVMINSTGNYDERRILFRKDEVRHGDLIDHENYKWLVTELPFFNKIHSKSKMVMANGEMTFHYEVSNGEPEYDEYDNPIPGTGGATTVTEKFPCVIKSISGLEAMTGQKINIAEGEMALLVPYSKNPLLSLQREFYIFEEEYRISGIDRSQVIGDSGILTLIVSKNT